MRLFTVRRFALALLALAAAAAGASAQPYVTAAENDLKGPVRGVRVYEAEFERRGGRLVEGRRRLGSVETYDARGRQRSAVSYTDEGEVLYGHEYVYDASGRPVEARVKHDEHVYLPDRRVYVYDARGRVAEERAYDARGRLLGRYANRYDERGRLTETDSIAEGENNVFRGRRRTVYTYDADGNRTGAATFTVEGGKAVPDERGVGYQREVRLHDTRGRIVITLRLKEDGRLFRALHTRHDERTGEIVEEAEYDADGGVRRRTAYAYEFDARGNWVSQTTSEWVTRGGESFFEPTEVSRRVISYHSDREN